jgi:hypothetical protein
MHRQPPLRPPDRLLHRLLHRSPRQRSRNPTRLTRRRRSAAQRLIAIAGSSPGLRHNPKIKIAVTGIASASVAEPGAATGAETRASNVGFMLIGGCVTAHDHKTASSSAVFAGAPDTKVQVS